MTLHYLPDLQGSLVPVLADHLWQSTMFAAAAGLLVLALRKNPAGLRHSLWLVASMKFLVPVSWLVALGGLFAWRHLPPSSTPGGLNIVEVVGQPFTGATSVVHPSVVASREFWSLSHLTPLLLGLWLCGFVVVLSLWIARWWRISAAARRALLLSDGRELAALRRLEQLAGMPRAMDILLSQSSIEPGVFGVVRPALLWPHRISEQLDDAHLEAVLAHELCHVRRRDNLAAWLHMFVEAVFWFHPLVWWMGGRLIEERERACDEAVIEFGSHRHTYAESILKVCEFCLSSPLTCVSGIAGADLKKRMVHIMTDRVVRKLNFARKLLLWTAACLAIALPIAFGLLGATPGRAESPWTGSAKFTDVSIKPHPAASSGFVMTKMMMIMNPVKAGDVAGYTATNVSLHSLIQSAYRIQETQLTGEPDWAKTERFDVSATIDPSLATQLSRLNENQRDLVGQQMLQALLADYFGLTLHTESKDLSVYHLVAAESGAKLHQNAGLQKRVEIGMMRMGMGELSSQGTPLSILTAQLSQRLGRTVLDKTGLEGSYAFHLRWTPDADEQARLRAAGLPPELDKGVLPAPTASAPVLATALEEQLGLKLEPATDRVQVLVVDHAEQPSQN
jgi:bla regulator protein BlaR1